LAPPMLAHVTAIATKRSRLSQLNAEGPTDRPGLAVIESS